MKKLYLLTVGMFPVMVIGQTITQNDLPIAGDAWTLAIDTSYVSSVPAGGTGQLWDYSMLDNNYLDTNGFISALNTPYAATFATSNLASYDPLDDSYVYFSNTSSGFYYDGIGTPAMNLRLNPSMLYIPVPFSYGDTRNNFSKLQLDSTVVDSLGNPQNQRFVQASISTFEADGSGTLITPVNTYPNVLRVKSIQAEYDTFYIEFPVIGYQPIYTTASQSTEYIFITSGLPVNYIMGLSADSLGTTSSEAQYYMATLSLGLPVVSASKEIVAYPNPATGQLRFKNIHGKYELIITDLPGREILHIEEYNGDMINISALKNGLYHYSLISTEGVIRGSFISIQE